MNTELATSAFAALGHTSRVDILRLLVRAGASGLSVTDMREHLNMPATTFGHHLKAMVEAGLVMQTRAGRSLISYANYDAIRGLVGFLMEDCCKGVFATETTELETS